MERNDELNEMRRQMELLGRKLESEKMVNEQLIRSIVSRKVATIRRENVWQIVSAVVMIPFCGVMLTQLTDSSLAFVIFTEMFFTAALVLQLYAHRGVSAKAIANGNLVETGQRLVWLKRFILQRRRFGLPLVFLWLVWFYFEVLKDKVVPLQSVAISVAAAITGIVWSVCYERKQRREIDDLVGQIDSLTQEE